MRHFLRERLFPVLALVASAAVLPYAALVMAGDRLFHLTSLTHFAMVATLGALVAVAAVVMTYVGARRREPRSVIVGVAFSAIAALLFIHALGTPGVLVQHPGIVALAGGINLPVGAAVLTLSIHPALRRPRDVRPLLWLQAALLLAITALGAVGLTSTLIPPAPATGSPQALALLGVGLALLALLVWRAASTYLLTRRGGDLLVAIGLVWLGGALVGLLTYQGHVAGFWIAHLLEFAGIALVTVPAALDLRNGFASHPLSGDLSAAQIVLAEEAFLGPRVRALMIRLSDKDDSTEEHTRRVALRAVQVGEELGLPPGRLRMLATGGLLHDIGKLSVPDWILQKPAELTEDEFAVIRRHPEWGARLLDELGGFSGDVRALVLDHHERLDGAGYPNGASAVELALETRILAVCDVYDALVSDRVYRAAWTAGDAIELLRSESGAAFDARCVEALERVLAREFLVAA